MTRPRSSSSASAAASRAAAGRYLPALLLALALAVPASAQTQGAAAPSPSAGVLDGRPVGVVDMAGILQNSNAIAQIRQAIDEKNALFEQEIVEEEAAIRQAEAQLNEDKPLITEDEFKARVAEFEKRVVALQRNIQQQRSSFDSAYADAQRRLEEQMLLIISEIAAENGYALVIQKKNAVVYDNTLDITEEVLGRLNEKTKNLKITLERKDKP